MGELPFAATWQGNYTHQVPATIPMEAWALGRMDHSHHELSILAARNSHLCTAFGAQSNQTLISRGGTNLPAPLKVYPLKPPGNFKQPCDTFSSASTAPSEMGEDDDEMPEMSSPIALPEVAQPMEEMCKEFCRELQVEPLDMAHARPLKVRWPVDSKKLRGRDKQIVSPIFEVSPGCSFKLMLKPKAMGDKKHQESFQKARGWGSIELKCVEGASLAPTLHFWMSVGGGSLRGPVMHDFSESTVSGLTKSEESFNFASAVDGKTSTFLISLQALPIDSTASAQHLTEREARFEK